ncbi:MAG: hypothetical protein IRY99_11175, partial [Isosphaeraceae bacterium]|nr:hypothetical protein [Isosphaeraceae bacterium]
PGAPWGGSGGGRAAGRRGLPGGSSLARLLAEHRGAGRHGTADRLRAWEQEQFPIKGPRLRLPARGRRPPLTIAQILAWADAHHRATGRWPSSTSGRVIGSPFDDTWAAIQSALHKGLRGLPGGSSLAQVLAEHRGFRQPLTIERILAWADAHYEATGQWPTRTSGQVLGIEGETWEAIDDALRVGRRGLPGGSTLAQLLAERRGARNMHSWGELTVAQILAWADAHHRATGRWPTFQSGPVRDAPGEVWSAINTSLYQGWRGLPGGSSLARLLAEHRGARPPKRRPDLTVEQILAWADAHYEATGRWPVEDSGPVAEAPGETWGAISLALAQGHRGLPGGSSLARLLAEHRGVRNPKALPRLKIKQILAWADAYHAATGRWPTTHSGPVAEAPGETWARIDNALKAGFRGLRGGSSLARLLNAHRPAQRRRLTMAKIRAWAEAHRQATGRWPDAHAGPVADAPGETWSEIDAALRRGHRGLPGGTSLTRLFGRSLNPDALGPRPPLTVEQVLAWADAHRAATGHWPTRASGPVRGVPGEKWVNLDAALRVGRRGLPSGTSLARLLAEHRGAPRGPASRSEGYSSLPSQQGAQSGQDLGAAQQQTDQRDDQGQAREAEPDGCSGRAARSGLAEPLPQARQEQRDQGLGLAAVRLDRGGPPGGGEVYRNPSAAPGVLEAAERRREGAG